jgi:5-methylcytosine-specific restriction endonuclease McrA
MKKPIRTGRRRRDWHECPKHDDVPGLGWWCGKIRDSCDRHTFGSVVADWSCKFLTHLNAQPGQRMTAPTFKAAAKQSGVPRKFLSRVLGATNGLITLDSHDPVEIRLHKEVLKRTKVKRVDRREIPPRIKERIKAEDDNRCGACGEKCEPRRLHIHHVIPLALLGADDLGNWVPACGPCNKAIWSGFDRTALKYYRSEKIHKFGVCFVGGRFWPVVNGRQRRTTLADLDR